MWLASMSPETLWAVWTYGDFRERATCMLAGPQGINWTSFLSLILCRDLCTWVGSSSPWNKICNDSPHNTHWFEENILINLLIHRLVLKFSYLFLLFINICTKNLLHNFGWHCSTVRFILYGKFKRSSLNTLFTLVFLPSIQAVKTRSSLLTVKILVKHKSFRSFCMGLQGAFKSLNICCGWYVKFLVTMDNMTSISTVCVFTASLLKMYCEFS